MADPRYKIIQKIHTFNSLKQWEKDFVITELQNSLYKALTAHEKNLTMRVKLAEVAKDEIITLFIKWVKIQWNLNDWIRNHVKDRIQKYMKLISKIEKWKPKIEKSKDHFSERPYQTQWVALLYKHFLHTLHQKTVTESKKVKTAWLLHAATGSGKSFIVWDTVNKIYALRDRLRTLAWVNIPLRILVLSDRIGTLRQTKGSLVTWYDRWDKHIPPIFSKKLRDEISTYEFHSWVENQESTTTPMSDYDTITFSTFQTAWEKDIWHWFNIILIAEWHHLPAETFYEAFEKYYQPIAQWDTISYPWVMTDTATPDGALLDITWSPVFSYPLYEYLASPWAPDVTYHIVACQSVQEKDIWVLQQMVSDVASIADPVAKYRQVLELKRVLNSHLAKFPDEESMVDDFIERAWENIWQTIIVCTNTKEANSVRDLFAKKLPKDKKVMTYHSRSENVWSFDMFVNQEVDVLVTVDMFIEAIDLPSVANVVLWRNIRSWQQYMQVLGRWMRWDEITYWDYVGWYANFARINDLYRKVEKLKHERKNTTQKNIIDDSVKRFSLLQEGVIDVESSSHTLDILTLMREIEHIEKWLTYKEAEANDIFEMYEEWLIHISDVTPQNWTSFARKWNIEFGMEKFVIPLTLAWVIWLLWWNTDYSSSLRYARALLKKEKFVYKPLATKDQLQSLWKKWILTKDYLWGRKYTERAETMNNTNTYDFEIPLSVTWLHTALYRYQRNPNTGIDFLASLLDEVEYIPAKLATAKEIKERFNKKDDVTWKPLIPEEMVTQGNYTAFAKARNEEYGKTRGNLPISIRALALLLNTKPQNAYIHAALKWIKTIAILPTATADQIRALWGKKVFTTNVLSNDKRYAFIKERNANEAKKRKYALPKTMRHLFTILGGKWESVTRAQTEALLNQTTYISPVPKANKPQLLKLYYEWVIKEDVVQWDRWKIFARRWNDAQSKKTWFTLPYDYKSLINQLWWDFRYDTTKEYGRALFRQEHFIRTPMATKEQIHNMIKNNIIPMNSISHSKWSWFAASWNDTHATLWLCTLPTKFKTFWEFVLAGTWKMFSPDAVRRQIALIQWKNPAEPITPLPIKKDKKPKKYIPKQTSYILEDIDSDLPLTPRRQKRLDNRETVKMCKIKAKEFYDKQQYGKAFALYYHAWTIDGKDILCKARMNEIKAMGIVLKKSDAVLALREIEVII